MKFYKIKEQQIQQIAAILLELPAKTVFTALDLLRTLPELEQKIEENKDAA